MYCHSICLHWPAIHFSNCTCRPRLWSRGNIVASHLAGPSSIPGRVSFPGWGFSSTLRQMTEKRRRHQSSYIIGHQTLLFRAAAIDFTISSLHFVASFYCRLAYLGKNCFLHKQLLTPGLPIHSLVCKLNGNSVATSLYPTLYLANLHTNWIKIFVALYIQNLEYPVLKCSNFDN